MTGIRYNSQNETTSDRQSAASNKGQLMTDFANTVDWQAFTTEVVDQFDLEGCFLFQRTGNLWIGDQPHDQFRAFLDKLFKTKPDAYFEETHFYKFREDDVKIVRYMAMVPLDIMGLQFDFLGVIYKNPEELQEILKHKMMTNYLVHLLEERMAREELERLRKQERATLLQELAEKKMYADQLKNKLNQLNDEFENIKASSMTHKEKVDHLSELLRKQHDEMRGMSEAYQDLYRGYQALETEFFESTVQLENKMHDLSEENKSLKEQLEARPEPVEKTEAASVAEIQDLRAKLSNATNMAKRYKEQVDMVTGDSKISPELISQLRDQIGVEKRKAEENRLRNVQLEMRLKAVTRKLKEATGDL